jgi:hypothetical protein
MMTGLRIDVPPGRAAQSLWCDRNWHDGTCCPAITHEAPPSSDEPQPMEFHGPGWTLERGDTTFWVWAPKDGRPQWAACWQEGDGASGGDFTRGDTLAAVLVIFPAPIARAFREATL